LISITADIGLIGFVPENGLDKQMYVNQHIALIRPDQSKVNPRYFAYYLASPNFYRFFLSLNGGGAKAGLSLKTINDIPLVFPPHDEQQKIVLVFLSIEKALLKLHENKSNLHFTRQKILSKIYNGSNNYKNEFNEFSRETY
jgi:type I restriction enzyme S subunit